MATAGRGARRVVRGEPLLHDVRRSLERIAVADPDHFTPPPWPPAPLAALVHGWERSFDPLLLARPAWYRATIWLDVLAFDPFHAAAIYAFARGREWIRLPSVISASMHFTKVFIILFDEPSLDRPVDEHLRVVDVPAPLPWPVRRP